MPKLSWAFALLLFVPFFVINARAQSNDISSPTPVRANEVAATIAPRDLGDARLTDHYYAFTGTPGDLMITVRSRNLNGDIDVFTATGLRPLLKFSVYAENSSATTKGIFLRKGEDLILRVEARTPNDDDGSYQISFGGAFAPIIGGPLTAETDQQKDDSAVATRPSNKKGRRVSSVGARIKEPEPPPAEVAAATPSPTPEATPAEVAATEKTTDAEAAKPTTSANSRRASNRRTTTRRRSSTAGKRRPAAESSSTNEQPSASGAAPETPTPKSKGGKRATTEKSPTDTATEREQETGPRLVIETREGTLIDRSMITVRRVTVENGLVVIVGRDGKIQRVPLADVVRMSIAP